MAETAMAANSARRSRFRIGNYNDGELATLIREGLPNSGMPRNNLSETDMQALVVSWSL